MGPVPLRLLLMAWALSVVGGDPPWRCPELSRPQASCMCDMPHTLRCITDRASLGIIARRLRVLDETAAVSLLDVTMHNETKLPSNILSGVSLHGLVISSGQLSQVSPTAFAGLASPLQALGLPSNLLKNVPSAALSELRGLSRLDLSHNKLVSLNETSFEGCVNLTFLDISENQLQSISSSSFASLVQLRVLRLRGNHINLHTIASLSSIELLEELDLSRNALVGPIDVSSLPSLPVLRTLLLGENQLSCARRGMLHGLPNLLTLSLSNNHIDVVEDHAFLELPKLRTIDLSNNKIVAVSGASLAHLSQLTELDLSHNFLRALTPDLVVPLVNLRELRLDDNDISIVATDALSERTLLQRLTLADNPLNCDCTLQGFAGWLSNRSSLPAADRRTAVCATPPALENALLTDISSAELKCGDDSDGASATVPLSTSQAFLRVFRFEGNTLSLLWSVDQAALPYTCDAIFIYEEINDHEVLLSSTPLRCNSSQLADPTTLPVRLPADGMKMDHRYRFCVVLLESRKRPDGVHLVLGCSEIVPLTATQSQPQPTVAAVPMPLSPARIAAVSANLTADDGALSVAVSLLNVSNDPTCRVTITVLAASSLAAQHHINCSAPKLSINGLPNGPYHVCATLGVHPPEEPRVSCVAVPVYHEGNSPSIALYAGFALGALLMVAILCVIGRFLRRPRVVTTHQCFLATDLEEGQHARYVKLQATTKL